ncbi:MAG: YdcF family protein [Syntrophorhabdaceae bacterium]|nr:YdcF family protein [Syntrophorhabdaceae bacterium]
MKKTAKKLTGILVVLTAFVVLGLVAIFNVVGWLEGSDQPVSAQAIMILSGPPSRALYAADLYNRGYAKGVYVTRPVREHYYKLTDDLGVYFPSTDKMQKDVLLKKGVAAQDIHVVGNYCKSTIDEAEVASRIFRGQDCTILVVSSPYHVKRAQMIFRAKMKECRFRVLATPYESFPEKWWTDQDAARNVLLEVAKITYYKLGGRFENSKEEGNAETGSR